MAWDITKLRVPDITFRTVWDEDIWPSCGALKSCRPRRVKSGPCAPQQQHAAKAQAQAQAAQCLSTSSQSPVRVGTRALIWRQVRTRLLRMHTVGTAAKAFYCLARLADNVLIRVVCLRRLTSWAIQIRAAAAVGERFRTPKNDAIIL